MALCFVVQEANASTITIQAIQIFIVFIRLFMINDLLFTFSLLLQRLGDALLTMTDTHLDAELLVDMLCQMLGRIDRAMLTARTTE